MRILIWSALLMLLTSFSPRAPEQTVPQVPGTRRVRDQMFNDIPANHWAFEILARCRKYGVLAGWVDRLERGNFPASRGDLADVTVDTLLSYDSAAAQLMPNGRGWPNLSPDVPADGPGRRALAKELVLLEPHLERLVREFAGDMAIFVNAPRMLDYLRSDQSALGLASVSAESATIRPDWVAQVPGTRFVNDAEYQPRARDYWAVSLCRRCTGWGLVPSWTERLYRGYYPLTRGDLADADVEILIGANSLTAQLVRGGRTRSNISPSLKDALPNADEVAREFLNLEPEVERSISLFRRCMPVFVDPDRMLEYLRLDKTALRKVMNGRPVGLESDASLGRSLH